MHVYTKLIMFLMTDVLEYKVE